MQLRLFARVRPTGRISSEAKLMVGPKAPLVDCTIVDYAAGGACLEICGQIELPNRLELLFSGTRKRCRVVWKAPGGLILKDLYSAMYRVCGLHVGNW
jgi:hypothetical protein